MGGGAITKRAIEWFLLNSAIIALAIYAVFHNSVWAGNLFKFVLWFFTIKTLIFAFSKDIKRQKQLAGKPVPDWLATLADITLAFTLAAGGWFFYATLTIIQGVLYFVIYTPVEKAPEKKDALPDLEPLLKVKTANAKFFVLAKNHLPSVLTEVRRLQGEVEELKRDLPDEYDRQQVGSEDR